MKKTFSKTGLAAMALLVINGCSAGQLTPMPLPVTDTKTAAPPDPATDQANATSIFQPERKIAKIVSNILVSYDHNRNGVIDYRSTATHYNDYYKSNENNRYGTGQLRVGDGPAYISVYTRAALFLASDANKDGYTTQEEVINFIKEKYDTNKDDKLSSRGIAFWQDKDEYQLFRDDYDEEFFKRMPVY